jgi:hypothetical protein
MYVFTFVVILCLWVAPITESSTQGHTCLVTIFAHTGCWVAPTLVSPTSIACFLHHVSCAQCSWCAAASQPSNHMSAIRVLTDSRADFWWALVSSVDVHQIPYVVLRIPLLFVVPREL